VSTYLKNQKTENMKMES